MPWPTAGAFDLAETVRRLGAAIWLEERCFELVGGWARSDLPAEVRVTLAELSRHHGWRAGELRSVLPEVPGFAAGDVVAPVSADVATALDGLVDDPGAGHVVAHARVLLAHLATAGSFHLPRTSTVSDPAIARALARVLDDLLADRVRAEAMAQEVLGRALASDATGSAVSAALTLCQQVETPLLAAGGACGRPSSHAL